MVGIWTVLGFCVVMVIVILIGYMLLKSEGYK